MSAIDRASDPRPYCGRDRDDKVASTDCGRDVSYRFCDVRQRPGHLGCHQPRFAVELVDVLRLVQHDLRPIPRSSVSARCAVVRSARGAERLPRGPRGRAVAERPGVGSIGSACSRHAAQWAGDGWTSGRIHAGRQRNQDNRTDKHHDEDHAARHWANMGRSDLDVRGRRHEYAGHSRSWRALVACSGLGGCASRTVGRMMCQWMTRFSGSLWTSHGLPRRS
jgi:hypothetical protein